MMLTTPSSDGVFLCGSHRIVRALYMLYNHTMQDEIPTSIPTFLDSLDLEQLRSCRDRAIARIEALESEPKVAVWVVVVDQVANDSWYPGNPAGYARAAERVAELAGQAMAGRQAPMALAITTERLRVSEADQLIGDHD